MVPISMGQVLLERNGGGNISISELSTIPKTHSEAIAT